MSETKQKVKPDWIPGAKGYQFRCLCPVCGITTVYQWSTSKNSYVCNREIPRVHALTEDQLEKTWSETVSESVKSLLGSKKGLPPDEPLTIHTTVTSRRVHVPNVGHTGSLSQGTIETKNSLGYIIQHIRDGRGMVGLTVEEWSFLYEHLEEIRNNPEIRKYIELQKPWDGFTWEGAMSLIQRKRESFAVNAKSSELTQARAKALEQYMPQSIQVSERSKLDHSQTQEAVKKAGSGELLLIPPKDKEQPAGGKGILAVGGTSELQKQRTRKTPASKQNQRSAPQNTTSLWGLMISNSTAPIEHPRRQTE